MKIREVLARFKSNPEDFKTGPWDSPDIERLANALNLNVVLYWSDEFSKRVKNHWVVQWLCTDTWVGAAIVTFDAVPVAITLQTARKNDLSVEFLSTEGMQALRDYILSLAKEEDRPACIDLDSEFPLTEEGYDRPHRWVTPCLKP